MAQVIYEHRTMRVTRALMMAAAASIAVAAVVVVVVVNGEQVSLSTVILVVGVAVLLVAAAVWRSPHAGLWFEYRARWRFREVCRHKGLMIKTDKGPTFPRLLSIEGSPSAFTALIKPLLGQSKADWERAAAAFALAYGTTAARIRDEANGTLSLLVGYRTISPHDFEPSAVPALSSTHWGTHLEKIAAGKREDGTPYFTRLLGSHVLVAGVTGAGKGSFIWSVLMRLMPAQRAGAVRFWGFDPKRMELALGRSLFADRYAATPEACLELLQRAHDEMQARADALAGRTRKFDASPEYPLELLVVDELGYLAGLLPDRKQQQLAERLLSTILIFGRAVGFVVIGALQDPRKQTVDYRDLFPTRVAMRLPRGMVDLVLGAGMYDAGAQCDLIPEGSDGAGVAFVVEDATLPVCVRMSWVSDELIRSVAADPGRALPEPEQEAVPLATVHQLHAS